MNVHFIQASGPSSAVHYQHRSMLVLEEVYLLIFFLVVGIVTTAKTDVNLHRTTGFNKPLKIGKPSIILINE